MLRLARAIADHPGRVVVVALLVVGLSLWLASGLGLVTDLVALLPEGAPEATEYRRFLELFGGFEKVFVVLVPRLGGHAGADAVAEGDLLEAADALAELLQASPEVVSIRTGLEPEEERFFEEFVVQRALLFVPESSLENLAERLEPPALERRAAELRALLRSPAGGLQARFARQDPLGFAADLPQLASAGELPIDPVTGAFRARQGDAALLVLTPAGGELDPEGGRRLFGDLDRAFADIETRWPGIEGRAIGGPLYAAQDETAIRSDMEKTVAGSMIGCGLILLLAFGGAWIPTSAVFVLACAFALAGGALAFGVGELTAVAFGFAAVLVGLGMDYAVHGAVRFRQASLQGAAPVQALQQTWSEAGPGIATSALTTAGAFAALGAAHFRPLRELGLVVAVGIVAILLMSVTLGSALLVLSKRRRGRTMTSAADPAKPRSPGLLWRALQGTSSGLVGLAERWPRTVLLISVVLTGAALLVVPRLRLEPDLSAMRPANHPVFETERILVERFGLGIDTATLVVEGADLDEVLNQSMALERLLEERVPGASVSSPVDWMLPTVAAEQRLARLRELDLGAATESFEQALAKNNLAPKAFAAGIGALGDFARGVDPGPPEPEVWPDALAELLRPLPDHEGWAAALRVRLPDGTWPSGPPEALVSELRAAAPTLSIAAVPRLGRAMKRMANADLGGLSALALLVVAAVVGLSFRGQPVASLLSLLPVTLGTLWTLGLWAWLDRPLDLLSLSVVPILLGIGIDDGLHAVHGTGHSATDQGRSSGRFAAARLGASVRGAGLAMALTTATTCVGFGSLAFSSIPGLARGGLLVPIGVTACLLATLLVLPALGSCVRKEA